MSRSTFSYSLLLSLSFTLSFTLALSFSFAAHSHELKGDKIPVGNGFAYTFVKLDAHLKPQAFGVVLTKEALSALPAKDKTYGLKWPLSVSLPPYNEVHLNWNASGHEPPDIYGLPHFDFHFYTIPKEEREAILCNGEDEVRCKMMPGNDYLPEFYIPTPGGVPMMGWHWLDSRSPELNGKRFTSTFIYGFYNAEMIFVEPMITREFLLSKGHIDQELSVPGKYAFSGYYPKKYQVNYDRDKKIYRITLNNLFLFEAGK